MNTLEKLRPDRDLQCYFFRPTAIAAMSGASATGYTVSGTWRQQSDWAVIEWNRDDVFEHPALRPLPDGDLSGLTLTYEESRENCIAMDSDLFATVDWPSLRIWADDGSGEKVYRVKLFDLDPTLNHATAIEGEYIPATVDLTLDGSVTVGDYVGLSFLDEHYSYQYRSGDILENALLALTDAVNASSSTMIAARNGRTVTLSYSNPKLPRPTGASGNRIGVYTYASGAKTEQWDFEWKSFSNGQSPTKWRVELSFGSLRDPELGPVPTDRVRKLRWTYSAELQPGAFQQSEFRVVASNWMVTGSNRAYRIAGPGTVRTENSNPALQYAGEWSSGTGNFSGGSIQWTTVPSASVSFTYDASASHELYLGTRFCESGATIAYMVDGGAAGQLSLALTGEDALVRSCLGHIGAGRHTVTATHNGVHGQYFYFDFFEVAIPTTKLPTFAGETRLALATDWDTDHSLAIAPERTAWLINTLGFHGRVNHYVGALWFYELASPKQRYASGVVSFIGTPDANLITTIAINRIGHVESEQTVFQHLNVIGDTTTTLAKAFELNINSGSTGIRAEASGSQLTIYARVAGIPGNDITFSAAGSSANLSIEVSGPTLSGGIDGEWITDVKALPRINRAARDWHQAFFTALRGYGLDAVAAFSMELGNGDTSVEAGIAQRYPSQNAVWLNTPALQTNFSPTSTAFWQQVYLEMANTQELAAMTPYLQFGEVQWWYKPDDGSGMPFHDAYTLSSFKARYGRDLQVIPSNTVDPPPEEAEFLPSLIGAFTTTISDFVRVSHPSCHFEVLYPMDVNDNPLNAVINYPRSVWTPDNLTCLKTESFTFTYSRNLDVCKKSALGALTFGFSRSQGSHLIGIADAKSPWLKEARMSESYGLESVVLFALDQLCLIGYRLPLARGARRSVRMG